jgi:hypothetical protein
MLATMDPWQADAVVVGEGHAPLWQYFWRLLKRSAAMGAITLTMDPRNSALARVVPEFAS